MNARQQWRNAIRDSGLDMTAKLVAHTLDTYLDGHGDGWPSRATIANGATCSVSAVKRAIHRLEAGGFLLVVRSSGRRTNRYHATLLNGFRNDSNGFTAEPVGGSNGFRENRNGFTAEPRTRSTELEEQGRSRAEEQKPNGGAYRKFDQPHPTITVDTAQLERAQAWLSEHRL